MGKYVHILNWMIFSAILCLLQEDKDKKVKAVTIIFYETSV